MKMVVLIVGKEVISQEIVGLQGKYYETYILDKDQDRHVEDEIMIEGIEIEALIVIEMIETQEKKLVVEGRHDQVLMLKIGPGLVINIEAIVEIEETPDQNLQIDHHSKGIERRALAMIRQIVEETIAKLGIAIRIKLQGIETMIEIEVLLSLKILTVRLLTAMIEEYAFINYGIIHAYNIIQLLIINFNSKL